VPAKACRLVRLVVEAESETYVEFTQASGDLFAWK
jgi:hypothetical protein